MGYALYSVDHLTPPFDRVHEQIGLTPQQGFIPVQDTVGKIIFVLGGECRHELVQDRNKAAPIHLRPGDVYTVPARHPQRYTGLNPETASRFHVIRLAFHPLYSGYSAAGETAPPPGLDSDVHAMLVRALSAYRYLPGAQNDAMRQTLAQLRDEARRQLPGYRARVWALCLSLTVLTCRLLTEQATPLTDSTPFSRSPRSVTVDKPALPAAASPQEFHVATIKDYLQRHQAQPLHLERIAEHVQLSREHIARIFRQETGVTIFHYLRACRIETAKTYLASTEKNLSEIAGLTGFSSLTLFSRTFRQSVGITASEYRRQSAGKIK